MFPDRRYYSRIASESGFRAGPLETVFRLTQLLGTISGQLGDELSLRGGSALNLLQLDLPRLSVDIDLDYVGNAEPQAAQQRRPRLLDQLETLARSAGYEITQERASYAMTHLRLTYLDASGRPAFIKLDLNFLDRVPVLPTQRRALRHPFADDLAVVDVQTLALPELAATKTIALIRRALARDLFDSALLSTLPGLDLPLLRTVLVVRGASYPPPSPADYSSAAPDRIRQANWRSEVVALARRPLPFSLEQAQQHARGFLERALQLDDGHHRFLRQLDQNRLQPELLPQPELHDRIALNPGLLWRLRVGADALEER